MLTVKIKTPGLAEADHSRRAELVVALQKIGQEIGDGVTKSGDVKDRNGRLIGDWSLTP
jgi:hypothetical protein